MGICDNCMNEGKVRRVELGAGAGIFLCDNCLKKEVSWRKGRNKTVHNKFRTKYKFK